MSQNKGRKPVLGGEAREGGQPGSRCQRACLLFVPVTCWMEILHVISAMDYDQPRVKTVADQPGLLSTPVCLKGRGAFNGVIVFINNKKSILKQRRKSMKVKQWLFQGIDVIHTHT